jgi:hypothetical protein
MKIWHIENENFKWEIQVGAITILKGSQSMWFNLVRCIDDYFSNKNSTIKIFEDTQLLHKKDWECLFIPFDANLQIDKLTAKSPLKSLMEDVCEKLSLSPAFHGLVDVWEELMEEVQFSSTQIEKYGLGLQVELLGVDHLKDFMSFKSLKGMMTPIEYKKLLLNLFVDKTIEKKRLIIIELPELYAEEYQFQELMNLVNQLSKTGIQILIVTQHQIKGNCNYAYDDQIINEARLENLKRKVLGELPFVCEEILYENAKNQLLKAVDNLGFTFENREILTSENEAQRVILFLLVHHLNIKLNLETKGFPPNIIQFLKSVS